jgi:hypothetical protein
MFPAIEKDLSQNKFFQAWKEKSIFESLLGNPPKLVKEFSEEWVTKLNRILGEGPTAHRYLVTLADYIEKIRSLEGYPVIKERLFRLDEQLLPTLAEIEFLWFLLLKTPPEKIHLEYTFETVYGKNPDIMVDYDSSPIYFDVTSVQDYKEKNLILKYFNILTAFQLSLKILYNINRKIVVSFSEYPSEAAFHSIYNVINHFANKGKYLFTAIDPRFTITMEKGANVAFDLPLTYVENKIKDKIEEKTAKFKEGNRNYVAIDVTSIVTDIDTQLKKIHEYFGYSRNKKLWGVLLQSKRWTLEGMEPTYKFGVMCQANSFIGGKEPFNTISALMPNSSREI